MCPKLPVLTRNRLNKKKRGALRIKLKEWREKLMNRQDIYSLTNFDFLACSFARMNGQGRHIDIHAVTGNMSKEQSAWFLERYNFYRMQGQMKATKVAPEEAELLA